MQPILASDFGNLYAFLLGVPALLLAVALFVLGLCYRHRWLHGLVCVISLFAGIILVSSIHVAKGNDIQLTRWFAYGAFGFSLVALIAAIFNRPRQTPFQIRKLFLTSISVFGFCVAIYLFMLWQADLAGADLDGGAPSALEDAMILGSVGIGLVSGLVALIAAVTWATTYRRPSPGPSAQRLL